MLITCITIYNPNSNKVRTLCKICIKKQNNIICKSHKPIFYPQYKIYQMFKPRNKVLR